MSRSSSVMQAVRRIAPESLSTPLTLMFISLKIIIIGMNIIMIVISVVCIIVIISFMIMRIIVIVIMTPVTSTDNIIIPVNVHLNSLVQATWPTNMELLHSRPRRSNLVPPQGKSAAAT